jgi:hypothetical protein
MTCALGVSFGMTTAAWAMTNASLPPEHTNGPVTYISGGIGADRSVEMRREASKFPLGLEFVQGKKEQHAIYLANVQVTIKDAAGKILLATRAEGPYLLAKLPDGRYTINAEHAGRSETRSVNVERGKHEMVVFDWAE